MQDKLDLGPMQIRLGYKVVSESVVMPLGAPIIIIIIIIIIITLFSKKNNSTIYSNE
jgi:hypothetical protein